MATKLKLRTKTSAGTVGIGDLEQRELIFGNTEDNIFVRTTSNNIRQFVYMDDSSTTLYNSWTATKIQSELDNNTIPVSQISDWAVEFASSFDTNLATKDTDDVDEGTSNLYFLPSRARDTLNVNDTNSLNMTYSSITGLFHGDVLVDDTTIEIDAGTGLRVKDVSIDVSKLAHDIIATGIGFDADKVDGKDVDDSKSTNSYIWTANKIIEYVDNFLDGLAWQDAVLERDLYIPPGSPSDEDRYVIGFKTPIALVSTNSVLDSIIITGDISTELTIGDVFKIKSAVTSGVNGQYTIQSFGSDGTNTTIVVTSSIESSTGEGNLYYTGTSGWSNIGPDNIVEYDLGITTWENQTIPADEPKTGWVTYVVEDVVDYVYNGTDWVPKSSGTNHNSLSSLQGGFSPGEYYHLDNTEYTLLRSWTGVKSANTVLAGPTTGGAFDAAFRSLVYNDIPMLDHALISDWDNEVELSIDNAFDAGTQTNISVTYSLAGHSWHFSVPVATYSILGVAKFNSENFDVSTGEVALTNDGIDTNHIDWGLTGDQVNTNAMPEGGTNLYYTNARVWSIMTQNSTDSITMNYNGAGQYSADVRVDDSSIEIDTVNHYIKVKIIDGGTF